METESTQLKNEARRQRAYPTENLETRSLEKPKESHLNMVHFKFDCPHCQTRNSHFSGEENKINASKSFDSKPRGVVAEMPITCSSCKSISIGYFEGIERREMLQLLDTNQFQYQDLIFQLKTTIPKMPNPTCPEHTPKNVELAFIEAENALIARLYGSAASGYRKTIDRAITPLVDDGFKTKMLGQKLGNLQKSQSLPQTMIDWISIVKDNGNYALHDDDRDFVSEAEIMPARQFTLTLLQYLFTMPEEVKRARAAIDERKQAS
ncbi:DUF4145 domain-containing protein [Ruegeria litorea]|uniref:DUF4145 domain-containing protein n=1 Tax=Falsiruegeria litorea TaxID=1280831 RepID=A0ABS5WUS7_9RHOB|nr:DUF4145 domain-containing protein [Falsiruegeria litorea]MBT3142899.1 DUF4145 domain-containing protein [Falsiruegeria litorea]